MDFWAVWCGPCQIIAPVVAQLAEEYEGRVKVGKLDVDANQQVLRPSIIWCDSRAAEYGDNAFDEIGSQRCLTNLLNSPGNFTASKLKWVKENESEVLTLAPDAA